ncbi:hypothetical protein M5K25_012087 [Dendrobium thyrsiflorum]|uniref:Secreted protein n=1 Tax=Dendrobium thyrsiflorum TaxID=117978 RepID=A0ABD0V393_DENTH
MECLHASTVSSSSREAFVCLRSSPGSSIMAWFLSIAGISLGSACSSLSRQLVCRKLFMPYFHHTLPLQAAQSDFFHPPPWTVNFERSKGKNSTNASSSKVRRKSLSHPRVRRR